MEGRKYQDVKHTRKYNKGVTIAATEKTNLRNVITESDSIRGLWHHRFPLRKPFTHS